MEKVRLEICHGAEFFRLEPLLVEVAAEVEFSFLSTEMQKVEWQADLCSDDTYPKIISKTKLNDTSTKAVRNSRLWRSAILTSASRNARITMSIFNQLMAQNSLKCSK